METYMLMLDWLVDNDIPKQWPEHCAVMKGHIDGVLNVHFTQIQVTMAGSNKSAEWLRGHQSKTKLIKEDEADIEKVKSVRKI